MPPRESSEEYMKRMAVSGPNKPLRDQAAAWLKKKGIVTDAPTPDQGSGPEEPGMLSAIGGRVMDMVKGSNPYATLGGVATAALPPIPDEYRGPLNLLDKADQSAPAQEQVVGSDQAFPYSAQADAPTEASLPMLPKFQEADPEFLNMAKSDMRSSRRAAAEEVDLAEKEILLSQRAAAENQKLLDQEIVNAKLLQSNRAERIQKAEKELNSFKEMIMTTSTAPDSSLIADETRAGVVAALVSGLGAVAQAFTGGPNAMAPLASMILQKANRAIERDVEAKVRRLDTLGRGMSMAERQLANIRQYFDSDPAFTKYIAGLEKEKTMAPILNELGKTKDERALAAYRMVTAMDRVKTEKDLALVDASLANQANTRAQQDLQAERAKRRPFYGLDETANRKASEDWAKLQRAQVVRDKLEGALSELSAVDKIMGNYGPNSEQYRAAKAQKAALMIILGEMGKAMTEFEAGTQTDILGNPESPFSSLEGVKRDLDIAIGGRAMELREFIKASGGDINPTYDDQLKRMLRGGGGAPPPPTPRRSTER